ncbi:RHS repeat-associated core domain-containing protein, partial [Streptomyces fradiae]
DPAVVCWLEQVADPHGNTVDIVRDTDDVPTAVVHSGGYRVEVDTARLGPDGLIRVTGLSVRDGRRVQVLSYTYDGMGDLTSVTNSGGLPLRFTYDGESRVTSWTDTNGSTFRYVYDEHGRVVETIGPEGFMSGRFAYEPEHRVTRYTDSTGATTVFHFNELAQVVARTDPAGHTVHQTWDRWDHLLTRTDELGRTTHYAYDEAFNLISVHLPDGSVSTAEYNTFNRAVCVTGPDGARWTQEWNDQGRLTTVTGPDGTTTRFTYDTTGALSTITDPLGSVIRIDNDPAGLPVRLTDPLGAREHLSYNGFGRPVALTGPTGETVLLSWTAEGRLQSRTEPDGSRQEWTYDGEGNCLTHTDALGRTTRFAYTHFDLLAARTGPDGNRHTFTYDTELRLTRVTDPHGRTWEYAYDLCGNMTAETDFAGRTLRYAYDAAGRLLRRTNLLGQTVDYAYDLLDRQISKTIDGATTTYEHDQAGRLLRASSPQSTLVWTYDSSGRVTAETVDGRELSNRYDAAGRRIQRRTPSGVLSTHHYDPVGHRTALDVAGRTLSFAYDTHGRETARRLPEGAELLHTWDEAGRLTDQALITPHPAPRPLRRSYSYRADGHLTAVTEAEGVHRVFDLDPVGRVTAVRAGGQTETYAYDEVGRQRHATWPDKQPQTEARGDRSYTGTLLRGAGSLNYEYDDAGRLVLRRRTRLSRKPDVWRYTWDAEDRLTKVITPDGTVWRYLYDPLGRRIAKQRLATDGATVAEETRFTWDGVHLVEQATHTAGAPDAITLTWEHDGAHPLSQIERKIPADSSQDAIDERFFTIVTDLVGTPTELVDSAGDVACRLRSTLWGVTTWNRDASAYTPLRFPGQYFDPETQLHYNVFRYYDPATALYVSPDPLGLDAGPDPYRYVLNPLLGFDFLGLQLTCKQNAKKLRENMQHEGRTVSPGQAAAHIVPSGGQKGHWAPGANARKLLQKYGIDINDAANGIALNHPTPHNYTHRRDFLKRLDDHLTTLVAELRDEGLGARAIRGELRSELREVGRQVLDELKTGQPGPNAVWTK